MADKNNNDEPQLASAKNAIDEKLKNNFRSEVLYIVIAENPTTLLKCYSFAVIKSVAETANYWEIVGFEVPKDNAFSTISDVIKYAKEENLQPVSIRIPWARVIKVENKTYKQK